MNIYIEVKGGYVISKDNVTVTGAKEPTVKFANGKYCITVSDIETTALGTNYTVTVGGEAIKCSVLSYANTLLNGDFSEESQNAMAALYEYYIAAMAYADK